MSAEGPGEVAIQDPCHLRHAQRVTAEPRAILTAGGYQVVEIDPVGLQRLQTFMTGWWFDEPAIRQTLADVFEQTSLLIDPHTAIGIAAARSTQRNPDIPVICVGTAHPAKFPDAVESATGVRPPLPGRLADLFERTETVTVLPPDRHTLEAFVRGIAGLGDR